MSRERLGGDGWQAKIELFLQTKMSSMEAQLDDFKGQVDRIREENSLLAGRNAVLEKVLALREEQLKASHQGFHPSPPLHPASLPVRAWCCCPPCRRHSTVPARML